MDQQSPSTTEILERVALNARFSALSKRAQECPSGVDLLHECLTVASMLLEKNRRYGDSALNPVRIFSKAPAEEQIRVRMDDKINRLMKGDGQETEDTIGDLLGYIVLLRVVERRKNHPGENVAPPLRPEAAEELNGVLPETLVARVGTGLFEGSVAVDFRAVDALDEVAEAEGISDFHLREISNKPDACQECGAPVEASVVVCDACYQRRFGEPKRRDTLAVDVNP